ncbi:DUF6146 family protein [Flavobacterium sp. NRK1]|uniref:DUF6146 family protein n=1 Tax=Flavobacterium sp. NRK1 TaxID=2954929 RepID=UPI00209302A2|nr:DUF6146 family protein [Flavobacterium sp. NRK1]MCO6149371.1 DUF6146 family protein [Flavobacterium sp. NRK1]
MKTYIIIIAAMLCIIVGCGRASSLPNNNQDNNKLLAVNDTVRIANDSLEYEIIIIDPGFNSWLVSRARPRGYYNQPYLENKNRLWVMEWNTRVMSPQRFGDMYQMTIDYSPRIDYGYEVNYLLYNYLVYFQVTNRQKFGGIVPQF